MPFCPLRGGGGGGFPWNQVCPKTTSQSLKAIFSPRPSGANLDPPENPRFHHFGPFWVQPGTEMRSGLTVAFCSSPNHGTCHSKGRITSNNTALYLEQNGAVNFEYRHRGRRASFLRCYTGNMGMSCTHPPPTLVGGYRTGCDGTDALVSTVIFRTMPWKR